MPTDPAIRRQRRIHNTNRYMALVMWLPVLLLRISGALRGIRRINNIPYTAQADPQQHLDIYVPADTLPGSARPVVLYLHGGGFVLGSRKTHALPAYLHARSGAVVFNICYRTSPTHRYPAALEDCAAAYRWVREHAAEYGGDPDRIVIAGESAGGNLTACLALAASYRIDEPWARQVWDTGPPAAALIICAMLQTSDPAHIRDLSLVNRLERRIGPSTMRDFSRAYLGEYYADSTRTPLMADPLRFIEQAAAPERPLPPLWIPIGGSDILLADNLRFHRALVTLGIDAELLIYPFEQHGFHFLFWRPTAARQYWHDCREFMRRSLSGQATSQASAEVQAHTAS